MRLATIDIGTNTVLLLVAEVAGDQLRVLEDRSRIEGLGQGVDRTGALDPAAIVRALDALAEYADAVRAHRVERLAVVGTQALREARNGAAFLEPAEAILGVPVEVISGEREAELAFRAVVGSFPELRAQPLVVFDVGGGSTEIIRARGGRIEALASVPIGAVRLAERHLSSDPPTPTEAAAMRRDVDLALASAFAGPLRQDRAAGGADGGDAERPILVGLAGTVTTLAAVALGLELYDPDRVQGARLGRAEVERQLATYLSLTVEERRRIRGLHPKRAHPIPGGAAIVAGVMAHLGAEELIVSDRGIRWGLAYELAARDRSRVQ